MINARITGDFCFNLHFTIYLTKRKAHRFKITGFSCNRHALYHCIPISARNKGKVTKTSQINDYWGQTVNTEPQNTGQCLSVPPSKSGNYECNRSSLSNTLNWKSNLKTHTATDLCIYTNDRCRMESGRKKSVC